MGAHLHCDRVLIGGNCIGFHCQLHRPEDPIGHLSGVLVNAERAQRSHEHGDLDTSRGHEAGVCHAQGLGLGRVLYAIGVRSPPSETGIAYIGLC